jgi:parvulin-like peptidyl-prolyl isomerase
VSYLEIPFSKFTDPNREITDNEVAEYYDNNLDEFQQKENRLLSYVIFPLTPTLKDTQRIYTEFKEIKKRYSAGEDFNDLAEEYSEDPAVKTNRGRYDYFERGAMVKEFEEAAFLLGKAGDLVGPVKTQYGLHLIKIENRRVKEGKDQAKVSHILLKITAGPSTREKQESAAAFFAEDARFEGFKETAEKEKLEIKQTNYITEDNQFIPGFGANLQIYNFAFRNNLGAVSEVIESETGLVVFHLTEIKEAGPRPMEEVKNVILNRLKTEMRKEEARNFAATLRDKIIQNVSFSQIAQNDPSGIVKYDSTDEFTIKSSPRGIGLNNIFNATAFSLQEGQISDEIETNRGIYWQKLLHKSAFDSTQFNIQKEMIRQRLFGIKRNQAFNSWYEYLKENADIEDNRKLFNL